MPIFDYECPRCHKVREVLVRSLFEVVRCPCDGIRMEKRVPAPGMLVTNFQNKPAPKSR